MVIVDDGVRVKGPVYSAQPTTMRERLERNIAGVDSGILSLVRLDDPEPDWRGVGDGKIVYTVVPTTRVRVSVVTCDPWDAETVAVRVLRML